LGTKISLDSNPEAEACFGSLTPVEWALGEHRFDPAFSPAGDEADGIDPGNFFDSGEIGETVLVRSEESETQFEVAPGLLEGAARSLRIWKVYQELAGIESPYIDRIREDLKTDIETEQNQKIEEMKLEFEEQMASLKKDFDGRMAAQLRERLLQLAGFSSQTTTE
jgi:hypothetical protein